MRVIAVSCVPIIAFAVALAEDASAQSFGVGASAEADAEGVEAEADADADDGDEEEDEAEEEEEKEEAEEKKAEPEEPEAPKGEGAVKVSAFVDAYLGLQTARIDTPAPPHRAYASNVFVPGAGGINENGFSLSFAGADIVYDGGAAGATISLRAGPSVPIFYGADNGPLGIDNITQAFLTWNATEALTLDVGQFGTIYGAEVAESWQNLNYTRGGLYYAMQPFWHTGLRAGYELNSSMGLNFLLVNGVNTITEVGEVRLDDDGVTPEPDPVFLPSFGAQFTYDDGPLSLAVGGLLGPEDDADAFNMFFDVVATVDLKPLTLVFNADYNQNSVSEGDATSFWGISAAAGYSLTDQFGLALRLEHLSDSDNAIYGAVDDMGVPVDSVSVTTVTGTFDLKPLPDSDVLVIRWDNRYEMGSEDIFFNSDGDADGSWFQSVLGLVVHSD